MLERVIYCSARAPNIMSAAQGKARKATPTKQENQNETARLSVISVTKVAPFTVTIVPKEPMLCHNTENVTNVSQPPSLKFAESRLPSHMAVCITRAVSLHPTTCTLSTFALYTANTSQQLSQKKCCCSEH